MKRSKWIGALIVLLAVAGCAGVYAVLQMIKEYRGTVEVVTETRSEATGSTIAFNCYVDSDCTRLLEDEPLSLGKMTPGEQGRMKFYVKNEGTVIITFFRTRINCVLSTAGASSNSIPLEPNDSMMLTVSINIVDDAKAGEYDFTLVVTANG